MRDHAAAPHPEARAVAAPPAPAGRAAEVLALQRRIGNAATGRWLARQTTAGFTNLCATRVPAAPGPPQRIDAENPLINTVAGPCITHPAGGYHWFVRYQLPLPAPVSGFIIQELWQQGSGGSNEHFWEWFEVQAGSREPSAPTPTPADASPPGVPYDDRYVHGVVGAGPHPTRGWYRHLGVARFYPGPLPPEFAGRGFTRTLPSGWTGQGTRHDCYAEWDNTGAAPRVGLVAFGGSEQWRAGAPVTARP